MIKITPEQIVDFARRSQQSQFETLNQKKTFSVYFEGQDLVYLPSTKRPRPHELKWLERVCKEFSRTNSFHPNHYKHLSMNASYTLALIDAFLKSDQNKEEGITAPINVTVFDDRIQSNAHDLFQKWRKANPNGLFLNRITANKYLMHNSSCYHPGGTDLTGVSLTKKPKVCARTIHALKSWALSHDINVQHCPHCESNADAPNILSPKQYENALWGILLKAKYRYVDEEFEGVPPGRTETIINRIIRNTAMAQSIKTLYKQKCQICGVSIKMSDGTGYSEAHHIRPLGGKHKGPDAKSNLLCVCPNHHVALDARALPLTMSKLTVDPSHRISEKQIEYHNRLVKEAMR